VRRSHADWAATLSASDRTKGGTMIDLVLIAILVVLILVLKEEPQAA
jgi:hypothetical protein